eukprot:gene2957-3399_t
MAFLLNYNFHLQKNGSQSQFPSYLCGANQHSSNNNQQNNQRSPPKKFILNHFDDSFPLETPAQRAPVYLRDEDEYRYACKAPNMNPDDQLMFAIDDI